MNNKKPKIYTTYFANVKNLPQNVIPVSIAGKAPEAWRWHQYKKLAPKWGFFSVWKQNHDNAYYEEHFRDEVLSKLDPEEVYQELQSTVGASNVIALVCYETPASFCHRHLVADWFRDAGIACEEWR